MFVNLSFFFLFNYVSNLIFSRMYGFFLARSSQPRVQVSPAPITQVGLSFFESMRM